MLFEATVNVFELTYITYKHNWALQSFSKISIVIDCNGLSLLIFEEKWFNYTSGPKSALKSDSIWCVGF